MATTRRRTNGSLEIRFIDENGKRRSLYPGKMAVRDGENIARQIERLVNCKIQGTQPEPSLSQWVASIGDRLHKKLVKAGLVAERIPEPEPEFKPVAKANIAEFFARYIEKHSGADSTITSLNNSLAALTTYFPLTKTLDSFTAGDAEDYRKHLESKGYSENTVRLLIRHAKQVFNSAIKHELLNKNPFAAERSAVGGDESKKEFVEMEVADRLIAAAPNDDFRTILALLRYGGLRSHEARIQRWEDIDLNNRHMTVRSTKTPPSRKCPIFPELYPYLLKARKNAREGQELVQERYSPKTNLNDPIKNILEKIGVKPWPRISQNLRASRESELLAKYPVKDVTTWLGNSPTVASKHYAMATRENFAKAIKQGAGGRKAESTTKSTPDNADYQPSWDEVIKAVRANPALFAVIRNMTPDEL